MANNFRSICTETGEPIGFHRPVACVGSALVCIMKKQTIENPLFPPVLSANWHFSIRDCCFCEYLLAEIASRRACVRYAKAQKKSWSKVEYPQEAEAASLRIGFIESSLWSEDLYFQESVLMPSRERGCFFVKRPPPATGEASRGLMRVKFRHAGKMDFDLGHLGAWAKREGSSVGSRPIIRWIFF